MDSKSWYASKTIWGALISVLGKVLGGIFGLEIDEQSQVQIVDSVVALISFGASFVGDAIAIWGRVKANKSIAKPQA